MIRRATRATLLAALSQVGALPLTRRAFHRVSVAVRGAAIVFLRCRRVLPDTERGRRHVDRLTGSALLPHEIERALKDCQRTLRFIHAGEALARIARGERLQEGAAVLTFDESFAATAECALPILSRLRVPALFFVTTEPLDTGETLWDQEIHAVLQNHAPTPLSVPWIDRVLNTDTAERRSRALRRLLLSMIDLGEQDLATRRQRLYERLGQRPHVDALDRMLNRAELRQLSRDPHVSIGAHGHRHFVLSAVSDATLTEELEKPRSILRELCGNSFADVVSYPFGRPPYYDDRVVKAAQQAGYRAGFTANSGVVRPGDHLFALPRLAMGRRKNSIDAYELMGVSDAVDELLHVVMGTRDQLIAELEG